MINFIWLASFARAAEYQPLQGETWTGCHSDQFTVSYHQQEIEVQYQYCSHDDSISWLFIQNQIRQQTAKVLAFAEQQGLGTTQCLPNQHLEIYQISEELLNQPGKFQTWSNQTKLSNGVAKVWGLYDPRPTDFDVSSLMLTNHGPAWNSIIFGHELSHYWYDRFCWNQTWHKGDEQFALSLENYLNRS